jgi:hypothetical protein
MRCFRIVSPGVRRVKMILKAWVRNGLNPLAMPYPVGTRLQVRDDFTLIETRPNQSPLERYTVSLSSMADWMSRWGEYWTEVYADPDLRMDIGL